MAALGIITRIVTGTAGFTNPVMIHKTLLTEVTESVDILKQALYNFEGQVNSLAVILQN